MSEKNQKQEQNGQNQKQEQNQKQTWSRAPG